MTAAVAVMAAVSELLVDAVVLDDEASVHMSAGDFMSGHMCMRNVHMSVSTLR